MKKRIGFVSNSSSSSFIIGVAKVLDEEKLKEDLYDIDDCKIISKKSLEAYLLRNSDGRAIPLEGSDLAGLKAPTNDEEPCYFEVDQLEDDDKILLVNIGHGEDDGPFYKEGFYGLDYSIVNEEYFKTNFPDSYKMLEYLKGKDGITERMSYRFGVSRNG
jgi:hypothetical protein